MGLANTKERVTNMFNRNGRNRFARLILLVELYIWDVEQKQKNLGVDCSDRLNHLKNRYHNYRNTLERKLA
jgi:hypothetical protein